MADPDAKAAVKIQSAQRGKTARKKTAAMKAERDADEEGIRRLSQGLQAASYSSVTQSQDWGTLFKTIDKSNDGDLSFEEFRKASRSAARIPAASVSDALLSKIFGMVDVDGSGTVGLQELIEFLKHGKCVPLKKTVPKKGKEASPVVPPADRKDVTVGLEPACQDELADLKRQLAELKEELATARRQLADLRKSGDEDETACLKSQLEQKKQELAEMCSTAAKADELLWELAAMKRQLTEAHEAKQLVEANLRLELTSARQELAELRGLLEESEDLKAELAKAQQQLGAMHAAQESADDKNARLKRELAAIKCELIRAHEAESEVAKLKAELTAAKKVRAAGEDQKIELTTALTAAKRQLAETRQGADEHAAELKDSLLAAKKQLAEVREHLVAADARAAELTAAKRTFEENAQATEDNLAELQAVLDTTKRRHSEELENADGERASLKAALAAAKLKIAENAEQLTAAEATHLELLTTKRHLAEARHKIDEADARSDELAEAKRQLAGMMQDAGDLVRAEGTELRALRRELKEARAHRTSSEERCQELASQKRQLAAQTAAAMNDMQEELAVARASADSDTKTQRQLAEMREAYMTADARGEELAETKRQLAAMTATALRELKEERSAALQEQERLELDAKKMNGHAAGVLASHEAENEALEQRLFEANARVKELMQRMQAMEAELAAHLSDAREARARARELQGRLESTEQAGRERDKSSESQLESLQSENNRLQHELDELRSELKRHEADEVTRAAEEEAMKQTIANLDKTLGPYEHRVIPQAASGPLQSSGYANVREGYAKRNEDSTIAKQFLRDKAAYDLYTNKYDNINNDLKRIDDALGLPHEGTHRSSASSRAFSSRISYDSRNSLRQSAGLAARSDLTNGYMH